VAVLVRRSLQAVVVSSLSCAVARRPVTIRNTSRRVKREQAQRDSAKRFIPRSLPGLGTPSVVDRAVEGWSERRSRAFVPRRALPEAHG